MHNEAVESVPRVSHALPNFAYARPLTLDVIFCMD